MRYRKMPVVIDAWPVSVLLHDALHNWKQLPSEVIAAYEEGILIFAQGDLYIQTLEGRMAGDLGDWLIRGVKGEFYPCKPDIFEGRDSRMKGEKETHEQARKSEVNARGFPYVLDG